MFLRCSSAPHWSKCPQWPYMVTAQGSLPDLEGLPAKEGTCAAWAAEMDIKGIATLEQLRGKMHENGVVVDDAMVGHLEPYVEMCRGWHAEYRVSFTHSCILVGGTSDAVRLPDPQFLQVKDLKYGFDPVEPTTPQITDYAVGVVASLGYVPEQVELSIFQPRAQHDEGPSRVITLTAQEFVQRMQEDVLAPLDRIAANEPAVAGSHCVHCPAANHCKTLTWAVYKAIEQLRHHGSIMLDGVALGQELEFIEFAQDLVKARKTALEAEAEMRIDGGKVVHGWVMGRGKSGTRKFKYSAEAVKALTGLSPKVRNIGNASCARARLKGCKNPCGWYETSDGNPARCP